LKNDVNVASKSNKQKIVAIFKVIDENSRIRRGSRSESGSVIQSCGSGSVPKCHGFATLIPGDLIGYGKDREYGMDNCLHVQEFPGVDQIKLEASDLCAVKLDPDLGVEYETVEDVSLEDAANVYFRQPLRM
jgi:hypothetical protein